VLAPAGARKVVWRAAQFGAAGGNTKTSGLLATVAGFWQAATPPWLIAKLLPEIEPRFVAIRVPAGTPEQPRKVEPPAHTMGRWFVSDPKAGKADPAKFPSPVDTG